MAAPRKYAPKDAAEVIKSMASGGHSLTGVAAHFKVVRSTVKRWFDEDEALEEAFEQGREVERQALHALIVRDAVAGKPANANAMFLLKCRHSYRENDSAKVDIAVNMPQPVLVIRDHGSDAEWERKVAEQQRRLIAPEPQTITLPLPAPLDASETIAEPESDDSLAPAPVTFPMPIAPAWKPRS